MSELTCLELSALLWVAHMLCQVLTNRGEFGTRICSARAMSSRRPRALLAAGRRARFAIDVENLVPFFAVDLALIATQHTGGIGAIGATLWIVDRIVYLPIYILGITYVRPAAWLVRTLVC